MKKRNASLLISLLIAAGTLVAQEAPTRPGPPEDRPKGPSAPRAIRDNEQFRVWAADFRTAREEFKTELQEMRQSLAAASDNEKQAIRTEIRKHLKQHQRKQLEFQKNVRRLMRELREKRTSGGSSAGSP